MPSNIFAQWTSQNLLTQRSPHDFVLEMVDISARLAALGHIHQSIELLTLANFYHPITPDSILRQGLLFAFETTNTWPDFVPAEHRTLQYLAAVEDGSRITWGHRHPMFQLYGKPRPPPLNIDSRGLRRLLEWIDNEPGVSFAHSFEGDEKEFEKLHHFGVVLTALYIAISLGGHENEITHLQDIIKQDVKTYLQFIVKSRKLWPILKDGFLETEGSKADTDSEFYRIKAILQQRLENGVQRPLENKTMKELLNIIDQHTQSHEYEDGVEGHRYRLDQQQPNNLDNNSIMHHPASAETINNLEKRFNTIFPKEYKEFLGITDGMNTVWNGFYKQSFVTSSFKVKYARDWEEELGITIPCELLRWDELPGEFSVDWPDLDFAEIIQLDDEAYGDLGHFWLCKPVMIKKAVDAFFEAFKEESNKDTKIAVEGLVKAHFGGFDKLRNMEWCVLQYVHQECVCFLGSFRDFIERLALESGQNHLNGKEATS